ncbi:MAG TPA: tape measure protein [Caulobacterales bacterium]|nr:tape measure protein [Caulobacterales bacterium]
MATEVERLVVLMEANAAGMQRQLDQAQRNSDRQLAAMERRFNQSASKVSKSYTTMAQNVKLAIAAIGVGAIVRDATKLADAWTNAGNKLRGLGVNGAAVASKQAELADMAVRTNTAYSSTVDLYSTILRAQDGLNISEEKRLKVVETVNKAIQLGGASAAQASSVVLQLGQALGSGVLQGDEFRSLRENSQILTKAIAEEFGVGTAQLKKLAAAGELTSDRVIKAFLKVKPQIDAAFKATNTSVGSAFTNLETRLTQYVGQTNEATGATKGLVDVINHVAENLDDFAEAAVVAGTVLLGGLAGAAVVGGVSLLATNIAAVTAGLTAMQVAAAGGATAMRALGAGMAFFGGPIGLAVIALGAGIAYMALKSSEAGKQMDAKREAAERLKPALEKLNEVNEQLATAEGGQAKKLKETKQQLIDTARNEIVLAEARLKRAEATLAAREIESDAANADPSDPRFGGFTGPGDQVVRAQVAHAREVIKALRAEFSEKFLPTVDINLDLDPPDGTGKGKGDTGGSSKASHATVEELQREHELNLARIHDDQFLLQLYEDQAEIAKRTAAYRAADSKLTEDTARAMAEQEVSAERIAQLQVDAGKTDQARLDRATEFADRAEGASANLRAELTELKELIDSGILAGLGRESDGVRAYIDGLVELARRTGDATEAIVLMKEAAGATDEQIQRGAFRAKKEAEAARATRDEELQKPFRYDEIRDDIKGALHQAFETGDWDEAFRDKLQGALTRALDRSLDRFVDGIFAIDWGSVGKNDSNGGGIISGVVGALFGGGGGGGSNLHFGGGRAGGGPVSPGMFYRVNENTPNSEWFMPKTPGTIFPSLPQITIPRGASANVIVQGNTYNFKGTGEEIAQFRAEAARMEAGRPAQILAVMRDAQRRRIA